MRPHSIEEEESRYEVVVGVGLEHEVLMKIDLCRGPRLFRVDFAVVEFDVGPDQLRYRIDGQARGARSDLFGPGCRIRRRSRNRAPRAWSFGSFQHTSCRLLGEEGRAFRYLGKRHLVARTPDTIGRYSPHDLAFIAAGDVVDLEGSGILGSIFADEQSGRRRREVRVGAVEQSSVHQTDRTRFANHGKRLG